MDTFNSSILKQLYVPSKDSHKGQNGKVLVIAGSQLFHAASLWSLSIASKIVDMVFYASVPENNELVQNAKQEFRNGIVIAREHIDAYIVEADAILIGPGLPRQEGIEEGDDDTKTLTESLLKKYPEKKWVIDGGSLQVINPSVIPQHAILTPHQGEFEKLFKSEKTLPLIPSGGGEERSSGVGEAIRQEVVAEMAKKHGCVILLKGGEDIVCSSSKCVVIPGGNAGMTKGGTGDVLAGLMVALYAQNNDPFLVASAASFLNKKAGEALFEKAGYYFNSSDLVQALPGVMKKYIL